MDQEKKRAFSKQTWLHPLFFGWRASFRERTTPFRPPPPLLPFSLFSGGHANKICYESFLPHYEPETTLREMVGQKSCFYYYKKAIPSFLIALVCAPRPSHRGSECPLNLQRFLAKSVILECQGILFGLKRGCGCGVCLRSKFWEGFWLHSRKYWSAFICMGSFEL